MSSLPAKMRMINSKMKELECSQDVRDVMDVLVTCKYEEDLIKNEGARVVTTIFSHYNPMGAIGCHGHQSSDPIWSKI